MKLFESLLTALRALRANKMRSALTMLGVIIGVGSVILLVSLGSGARACRDAILDRTDMGANARRLCGGARSAPLIGRFPQLCQIFGQSNVTARLTRIDFGPQSTDVLRGSVCRCDRNVMRFA